ncbi:hypothetical protein B0H14DRAFT_3467860 [Mycena olivaceomarginata]|nr:hypothetical protein B0H14DRAFT_3467860 [Mycena olivaceomarginata]
MLTRIISFRPLPLHWNKNKLSGPTTQALDLLAYSELLDIVLIASVNGNSMPSIALGAILSGPCRCSPPPGAQLFSPPLSLVPLVRTRYIDQDPDLTDDYLNACWGAHIIEPQSGDIYVMTTPSSLLRHFPYSVPELVDMSPFSFSAAADDHHVFMGWKATAEVVVELEMGRSDLEGPILACGVRFPCKPLPRRREVVVSRTVPTQTLAFSIYGPSGWDNVLQGLYRSTEDRVYMQSLLNREVIAFKTESKEDPGVRWGRKFKSPIPVHSSTPSSLTLCTPPPMDQLQHLNLVYVGLVDTTGSLFAMSPDRFPLVVFSSAERGRVKLETAGGKPKQQLYGSENEDEDRAKRCLDRSSRRCLVGMYLLEGGDRDGPEYRLKQLIDGDAGCCAGFPLDMLGQAW